MTDANVAEWSSLVKINVFFKCIRLDVSLTTTTVHYHTYVIWDNKLVLLLLHVLLHWSSCGQTGQTGQTPVQWRQLCEDVSSDYETHSAASGAEDTSDKLRTYRRGGMVVCDCGEGGGAQHKGRIRTRIRIRIYVHLSLSWDLFHILICPARLLDSFDLRGRNQTWICVRDTFYSLPVNNFINTPF